MNYLDELLLLYPSQPPLGQRYLLTHASGLPLGIDSDALVDFLWGETVSPVETLGAQARRELGRVAPARLRLTYGLESSERGIWSAYEMGAGIESLAQSTGSTGPDEATLGAAYHCLSRALERTLEHLGSGSDRVRQAASLVAGQLHTRTSLEVLIRLAGATPSAPHAYYEAAVALSELGIDEARNALLASVRRWGAARPDLIPLLAGVPLGQSLPVLDGLDSMVNTHGHCAMAQALVGDETHEGRDLLVRLLMRQRPWITAYGLDTVASCPRAEDLAVVVQLYKKEKTEFLRLNAVKVAGEIPSPEVPRFLQHVLAKGSPPLQAAALESLARQKVEPGKLTETIAALLESPAQRLRTNAILVIGRRDPRRVHKHIEQLLLAQAPMARIEGAFVLGYLRSEGAASVLEQLALKDRSSAVRTQAAKSLAKYEPRLAIPRLVSVLGSADARLVGVVARALASLAPVDPDGTVSALETAASRTSIPAQRGVLLRALGLAACTRPSARIPPLLLESLADGRQPVVLGALEGLKGLGGDAPPDALAGLVAAPDPRIRYRAAVATFLCGRTDAGLALDELIRSPEESQVLTGLTGLLELAALIPAALASRRFAGLGRSLETRSAEPSCVNYVQKEAPRPTALTPILRAGPATRARAPVTATEFEPTAVKVDLGDLFEKFKGALASALSAAAEKAEAPLARQAVEGSSYLSGLRALPQDWSSWVRTYQTLLIGAAAFLIPVIFVVIQVRSRLDQPGEKLSREVKVGPGQLKLVDIKGQAILTPAGKPASAAALRKVLHTGDRIATAADSRLMLSDGAGNSVWLSASSAMSVGNTKTDATTSSTSIVITEPGGDLFVDYRRGKTVEVIVGRHRVMAVRASFRVKQVTGGHQLTVSSGLVTHTAPGQSAKPVKLGDEVNLTGGS